MFQKLLLLLVVATCVFARTAVKQETISGPITSLTDKDARIKAKTHTAFRDAGTRTGLEIWRIQYFEPVPIPQSEFGKFSKGDSYIILKTTSDNKNKLSWDIHYWIGSESTQDESGAAAILTVGLDDKFNGAAVQHRETEGYESQKFLTYFPRPLQYVAGGTPSGFRHVETNAGAVKRLLQIKGKKSPRVRQVEPVIASMNKGDCFILDVEHSVYVYVGPNSKMIEKLKATSVANQIRDQDHRGRARVEIMDQYSNERDMERFFVALGSGSADLVPEESAGGDDVEFEKKEEQTPVLYEVAEVNGHVKVTPLSRPFRQEQLKPQESYVLETVSGSIYVWMGKQSTEKEKSEALSKAHEYLRAKKYPSWVQVEKIIQNAEPAIFKQYFNTWRDMNMSHSRII